jgi:hypothetical protein
VYICERIIFTKGVVSFSIPTINVGSFNSECGNPECCDKPNESKKLLVCGNWKNSVQIIFQFQTLEQSIYDFQTLSNFFFRSHNSNLILKLMAFFNATQSQSKHPVFHAPAVYRKIHFGFFQLLMLFHLNYLFPFNKTPRFILHAISTSYNLPPARKTIVHYINCWKITHTTLQSQFFE